MEILRAIILSLTLHHQIAATPLDQPGDATVAIAAAVTRHVFLCDDAALADFCRSPPYNFRCTLDGHLNADLPLDICRDQTRCSCEPQSPALNDTQTTPSTSERQ